METKLLAKLIIFIGMGLFVGFGFIYLVFFSPRGKEMTTGEKMLLLGIGFFLIIGISALIYEILLENGLV